MRILAIRGKNLASLAGDFAVELEHGVLERAGLFAITGRTGSGKSTLLDAMCLALFGRTPRLSTRSRVRLGGDGPDADLRDGDPRVLLRRGTGEGFAEVDFEGKQRRRWRARWTVRRAHGDPDQRLQNAVMSLEDLHSGRHIGDTKTDVLEHIQSELGLNFEQFTRSVLLAQGDFAAFLQAPGRDRAALLEKMTGTELYALISVRCHERKRDEEARLDAMRTTMRAHALLTAADREALSESLGLLVRVRTDLVEERKQAQERVTRLELIAADAEELARVEADRKALAESVEQGADRLAQLRGLVAVAPLRAALAEAVQARGGAESAHVEQRTALAAATSAHEAAVARCEEKARELETQRARAEALAPSIDEALRLDTRLVAVAEELEAATEAVARRARIQHEAEAQVAVVADELAALQREAHAHEAWLAEHPVAARLAEEWGTARAQLTRVAETGASLTEALAELGEAEAEMAEITVQVEAGRALVVDAAGALSACEAELAALSDPRAELAALERRIKAREQAEALLRQRTETRARAEVAQSEEREAHAARTAAEHELVEVGALREPLAARVEEARLAAERAQAAADLTAHRHLLVEGQPCPLCGATEHAVEPHPLDGLVADARDRHRALAESLRKLADRDSAARAKKEAAERAAAAAAARVATEHRLEAELTAEMAPLIDTLGAEPTEEMREAQATESSVLVARREARERAEQRLSEARRAQAVASERLSGASEREVAGKARVARASAMEARARQEWMTARTVIGVLHGEAWPEPAEAAAFVARWLPLGEQAAAHRAARAQWELQRESLGARRDAALAAAATAVEEHGLATRALEAIRERAEALRKERATVLDHPDARELEQSLKAELGALDEAHRALAAQEAERRRIVHEAQVAATATAASLKAAVAREAEHAQRVRAAAEAHGLDAEALPELSLAEVQARLSEAEAQVAALDEVRHRARVLGEQLAERRARWEGTMPDLADARAELDSLSAKLETTTRTWSEQQAKLNADDEARRAQSELEDQIEAQAVVTRRWLRLHELIGSHDGSKLRKFAQSLTLDALLSHANAHLGELAPRYRLVRVPGEDLELQVIDGDMGDDVRPITSLSGGESFLVSLALALGLSSLAARDVRIDSLFIDEGFGTLDHQTLQVVLDTLDTLQATGRKVGVISHVAGIAERVGFRVEVSSRGSGRSTVSTRGVL